MEIIYKRHTLTCLRSHSITWIIGQKFPFFYDIFSPNSATLEICFMFDTQQPIKTQQEGLKLVDDFFFGIDGKSLHAGTWTGEK